MLTKVEGPNLHGEKIYTFNAQYTLVVPQRYAVKEIIGRGAYGIVCSALDTTTGESVAVKKVSRLFEDAVDAKRLLREIKLLAFLDYPGILQLKDLFHQRDADSFTDLYIVTELMQTDIHTLLRSPKVRLSSGHCQYFSLQLLCALQYMHSAHVLHRDLKPGNLLTDADCNLKLCDFGLARGMGENMTHYVVTRWYRPPELLLVCKKYSYSVDLWAAGCLAVEMVTAKPLFPGRDYINQINLIVELLGLPDVQHDLPEGTSEEAMRYLQSLPRTRAKSLREYVPELYARFQQPDFFDSFDDAEEDSTTTQKSNSSTPTAGSNGVRVVGEGEEGDKSSGSRQLYTPEKSYAIFERFAMGMLQYNPDKRLTARQAIAHPWLADVRGGLTEMDGCDATQPFTWELDDKPLTMRELRELFVQEIKDFRHRHPQ